MLIWDLPPNAESNPITACKLASILAIPDGPQVAFVVIYDSDFQYIVILSGIGLLNPAHVEYRPVE